jgi:uncharacterized protein Smg (DUF494 family)
MFREQLIKELVKSTIEWLDYLDYKSPDEADEEDILLGLRSYVMEWSPELDMSCKDLLLYLEDMPHSQYKKIIKEVLSRVEAEWNCELEFVDDDWICML